jgi:hypothetical protein
MSRRTKLIIVVIFLVLLAIPTAYVAISWRPTNPLQFRLKSIVATPESERGSGLADLVIQVSIKNRSSFPMYFYGAMVSSPHAPVYRYGSPGSIMTEDLHSSGLGVTRPYRSEVAIPAHGEIEVTGILDPALMDSLQEDYIFVRGAWQSHTRSLAAYTMSWIRDYVPQWARDSIPDLNQIEETAPLETKGHAPSPAPTPVPSAP